MQNDVAKKSNLWRWQDLKSGFEAQAALQPAAGTELPASLDASNQDDGFIQRVVVDSRLVTEGDLFVALPGDPGPRFNPSYVSQVDGHDFVGAALANGAVAAIVARPIPVALPQIVVSDTYDALWHLGDMARKRLNQPVCAITGSSGKTTAKHFLTAALSAYSPPGSFNNHIGVPLALANATLDAPAWVFEIGTSSPGEIGPLANMVKADLAILLNVHNAHIENFSGREALIAEKTQIFAPFAKAEHQGKSEGSAGIKIVEASLGLPGYTFGDLSSADARILEVMGDRLVLTLFGEKLHARIPGGGAHRANTLAAVILATKLLDKELSPALNLDDSAVPTGRGNVLSAAGVTIVDDSYNANPASMQAAIAAFCQRDSRRKIAVLGEMRELGDESAAAHKTLLTQLGGFDEVILVGSAMLHLAVSEGLFDQQTAASAAEHGSGLVHNNLHFYPEASELLLKDLTGLIHAEDALLIKGSNRVFWARDFVSKLLKAIAEKS